MPLQAIALDALEQLVGIGVLQSAASVLLLRSTSMHRSSLASRGLDLMRRAHQDCPYSRATRGNIEVRFSVRGAPADDGCAAA